jgi:hypothetical protein
MLHGQFEHQHLADIMENKTFELKHAANTAENSSKMLQIVPNTLQISWKMRGSKSNRQMPLKWQLPAPKCCK